MVYLIMQHLPLLQEYLSSWQQGTLRSSPVTKLIPAFHEQLGASPALQAARGSMWRVSHCPHIKGPGRKPCQEQSLHTLHTPSCSHGVCTMSWSLPSLGLLLLKSWHTSGPQVTTGRESWSMQLSPKNNAGHEPLAFVLFKSPGQNKRAEGMA